MDKRVKIFLIVCASAFASSFVIQTVFQKMIAADMSTWGGNPGWQREIAMWNVGCAVVSIASLRLKSSSAAIPAVLGFTVLFLCLGTNHLFRYLSTQPASQFHWPPFIANYVSLFFGAQTLYQFYTGKLVDA